MRIIGKCDNSIKLLLKLSKSEISKAIVFFNICLYILKKDEPILCQEPSMFSCHQHEPNTFLPVLFSTQFTVLLSKTSYSERGIHLVSSTQTNFATLHRKCVFAITNSAIYRSVLTVAGWQHRNIRHRGAMPLCRAANALPVQPEVQFGAPSGSFCTHD